MLLSYYKEGKIEAGVDEAGRGCYAGPVCAAAVILPASFQHPLLNDSKKMTREERDILRPIIEKEAIAYTVQMVSNIIIDRINILQATYRAMHLCINKLEAKPDLLLIDGNRFLPYKKMEHCCVIKGDGIYSSIAAASVLAKTYRDAYMRELHVKYSHYGWDQNKGYGTSFHRTAIDAHGLSRYHRKSFRINPTEFICEEACISEML